MGGAQKPQPVVMPPPVVTRDPQEAADARREQVRMRALWGRRGTMRTGPMGAQGQATLGTPAVLGLPAVVR